MLSIFSSITIWKASCSCFFLICKSTPSSYFTIICEWTSAFDRTLLFYFVWTNTIRVTAFILGYSIPAIENLGVTQDQVLFWVTRMHCGFLKGLWVQPCTTFYSGFTSITLFIKDKVSRLNLAFCFVCSIKSSIFLTIKSAKLRTSRFCLIWRRFW